MIRLEGQERENVLKLREEWYSRFLANNRMWNSDDLEKAMQLKDALFNKYGIPEGSTIDLKCALLLEKGYTYRHNHHG